MGDKLMVGGEDPPTRIHIGIVGAGISGLRCADILLANGFEVTILEARSRIGGRICQSDVLGYTVDIGPNWIHAWTDSDVPHPLFKLANDTKTPLHKWNNKQLIYDSLGRSLPDETTDRLSTMLWEIIEEAFKFSEEAYDRDNGKGIPKDDSLHDFVKRRAAEVVPDEQERGLLIQMSEMFGAYVGEPIWKQSLRFAWMEECCGGDEMFVESNYSNILKEIARPAVEADNAKNHGIIRLGKLVTQVITRLGANSSGVKVTTADGDEYSFDGIVLSMPLGWLKRNHREVFVPSLPLPISNAISNISLSQLEKVFITFPSVFWTLDPSAGTFPCYVNWLTPTYADSTNQSHWPQEIWDLSSFKAPNNHPTILFYLYGDCSRHIVNSIHGKTEEEKFRFLDNFFRPYYSRLPNYDPEKLECKPDAILATEWLKDELNGFGSYCNFQVGIEDAAGDLMAIRNGCPDRRMWFCGEHAAPFEECGTVTGAYLSGEGAAKKIVEMREQGKF